MKVMRKAKFYNYLIHITKNMKIVTIMMIIKITLLLIERLNISEMQMKKKKTQTKLFSSKVS